MNMHGDGPTVEKWKDDNDQTDTLLGEETHAVEWKLTFYADDFWPVPLAVGATLGGGHMALQEAVGALVARHRVDVVVGALPTNQEGVVHGRRGSAQHWRGDGGEAGHDMKAEL